MTNNLQEVIKYMLFPKHEVIYHVFVVQRKKDGAQTAGCNNRARSIKSYYVTSVEYLLNKMPEIIKLCEEFNARAYINLCRKTAQDIALTNLTILADRIKRGDFQNLHHVYDTAVGKTSAEKGFKYWILDIDAEDMENVEKIKEIANSCMSGNDVNVFGRIPSKHGCHLLCRPFNKKEFEEKMTREIGARNWGEFIHDQAITNLYIP